MFGTWNLSYGSVSFDFGTPDFPVQLISWEQDADQIDSNDVDAPRADETWFGEDFVRAGEITVHVKIDFTNYPAPAEECARLALIARAELERVWRADWVRARNGRQAELNMGGESIIEGRPRRARFQDEAQNVGLIYAELPFVPSSTDVYLAGDGSGWNSVTSLLVPPTTGGWMFPLVFPISNLNPSVKGAHFKVGGDKPAWVRAQIKGPIQAGAELELVGGWKIKTNRSLAYNETAEVDARPGRRTLTINGKPNNFLTPSSSRMSSMLVPVGDRQIALRGTSLEGTASATVWWRDTKAGK